jgi:hypothetical protein
MAEEDKEFVNNAFVVNRWNEMDEIIRPSLVALRNFFGYYNGSDRPHYTITTSPGGDTHDRYALDGAIAAVDKLAVKLRAAREMIPAAIEYTPVYYKKQFYSYEDARQKSTQRLFSYELNHRVAGTEKVQKLHLLDIVWLCKVCIDIDITDIKATDGTFLAHLQNIYKTFDFTGYVGPTISEPLRFHTMFHICKKIHRAFIYGNSPNRVSPGAAAQAAHVKQEK